MCVRESGVAASLYFIFFMDGVGGGFEVAGTIGEIKGKGEKRAKWNISQTSQGAFFHFGKPRQGIHAGNWTLRE